MKKRPTKAELEALKAKIAEATERLKEEQSLPLREKLLRKGSNLSPATIDALLNVPDDKVGSQAHYNRLIRGTDRERGIKHFGGRIPAEDRLTGIFEELDFIYNRFPDLESELRPMEDLSRADRDRLILKRLRGKVNE